MSSPPQDTRSPFQVILVMGVTGVGKSTFIEYATGLPVGVGHGQGSCKLLIVCEGRTDLIDDAGTAEVKNLSDS